MAKVYFLAARRSKKKNYASLECISILTICSPARHDSVDFLTREEIQEVSRRSRVKLLFSCPGRMFSYCVRARAYTHVLARVYSTRASTCTIYTCFTLPPTRVNPTGLQLSIFQQFWSFVTNIRTSMLPNKFYGRAQPN